jgi:hypothetical protein
VTYVVSAPKTQRGARNKYVRRADGRHEPIVSFEQQETRAHAARMGAMSPKLFDKWNGMRPGQEAPVAIYFDLQLDWNSLEPGLKSRDLRERQAALATLRGHVSSQATPFASEARRMGGRGISVAESMPMFTAILTKEAISALAHFGGLLVIFDNERAIETLTGVPGTSPINGQAPNGDNDSLRGCVFNRIGGLYGSNSRIGIIETRGTGFYKPHDALYYTPDIFTEHQPYGCAPDLPDYHRVNAAKVCYWGGNAGLFDVTKPKQAYEAFLVLCGDGGFVGDSCLHSHTNTVLTSMATSARESVNSTSVTPHGVPGATFFFANQGKVWESGMGESLPPNADGSPGDVGENWQHVRSVGCDAANTPHAYDYLVESGVTLVNESYYCEGFDPDGAVQDYYSRHAGLKVFRAAGNFPGPPTSCRSFNSLCVGNNLYGGRDMNPFSSYRNFPGSDREEPDITALGTQVDTVSLGAKFEPFTGISVNNLYNAVPHDCFEAHGTTGCCSAKYSFGSNFDDQTAYSCVPGGIDPVETHCGEGFCRWLGDRYGCTADATLPDFDPTLNAPVLCVADDDRHLGQNTGTSFATPIALSLAALLDEHCGFSLGEPATRAIMRTGAWRHNPDGGRYSTPDNVDTGSYDDRDGAGSPTADALSAFCGGLISPGEAAGPDTYFSQDITLDATQAAPLPDFIGPSDRVGGPLSDAINLRLYPGDRFRATLSWDSCQASSAGNDPVKPLDLDLALCTATRCIAWGTSFDDCNEGFDVDIDTVDNYQLWWTAPAGAAGCDGKPEPVAIAVAWGSGQSFTAPTACESDAHPVGAGN